MAQEAASRSLPLGIVDSKPARGRLVDLGDGTWMVPATDVDSYPTEVFVTRTDPDSGRILIESFQSAFRKSFENVLFKFLGSCAEQFQV